MEGGWKGRWQRNWRKDKEWERGEYKGEYHEEVKWKAWWWRWGRQGGCQRWKIVLWSRGNRCTAKRKDGKRLRSREGGQVNWQPIRDAFLSLHINPHLLTAHCLTEAAQKPWLSPLQNIPHTCQNHINTWFLKKTDYSNHGRLEI